jgi:NADH:quinone reductase (non-electrogenic)
MAKDHHVVIIGGGFGGLNATQCLKSAPVAVTLIDRRNFHLFQPLLYQVATGWLSPANIAATLRATLKQQRNTRVLLAEATGIDVDDRRVVLHNGSLTYDTLIVATGARHHYFGNDPWAILAPGLKTVEDATEIRSRIFLAFEAAEHESNPERLTELLTFVIIGGGPTGVELAEALGKIANDTLKYDFRNIDPAKACILLIEAGDRILPAYPPKLSAHAEESLNRLGVIVLVNSMVTDIQPGAVTVKRTDKHDIIPCRTAIWAAGVEASFLGNTLAQATGVQQDRNNAGLDHSRSSGDICHRGSGQLHAPDRKASPGCGSGRHTARSIRSKTDSQAIEREILAPIPLPGSRQHGDCRKSISGGRSR